MIQYNHLKREQTKTQRKRFSKGKLGNLPSWG